MIQNLTFFETTKELETVTGLSRGALWEAGFNLDDMDWGFCSDTLFSKVEREEEYDYEEDVPDLDAPYYAYHLLSWMYNHCVGFRHVEYGGKHYYMLYHS